MPRCSFCGKDIPKGTGTMYVKKDGKILYFTNSKCEKNLLKLKRKPRVVGWTNEARKEKQAGKKTEEKKTKKEKK
ncbi:50S ribosomal protein L24e [Nanoarchaeota archaeon]